MLSEFDLHFRPQKSVKGRAVSDFLAEFPTGSPDTGGLEFSDEQIFQVDEETWKLYFDGAANKMGCGVGVLLVSPEDIHFPLAVKLVFEATNNAAEYEACILSLRVALAMGIKRL